MGVETSDSVERVVSLERKIFQLRRNLDDLASWRIPNAEQNLAMLWAAASRRCTTTITGKIIGGDAAATPLAGATVQVTGHTSGVDYGTFTATTGTYSIGLLLQSADLSVDLIVTGPGARFTAGSAVNKPVVQCASNSVANIQATPATGYHYLTGTDACQYPIKNTLTFDEPILYGTHTISWTGGLWGPGGWCQNQTSVAGTGCATPITCGTLVYFDDTVIPVLNYPKVFAGICPVASLCPSPSGPTTGSLIYGFVTTKSITCPDNSTLFSVTFSGTVPAGHIWYPSGPWSITYYET